MRKSAQIVELQNQVNYWQRQYRHLDEHDRKLLERLNESKQKRREDYAWYCERIAEERRQSNDLVARIVKQFDPSASIKEIGESLSKILGNQQASGIIEPVSVSSADPEEGWSPIHELDPNMGLIPDNGAGNGWLGSPTDLDHIGQPPVGGIE